MRFLFGFGVASMLWGAAFGMLYAKGWLTFGDTSVKAAETPVAAGDEAEGQERRRKRTRRPKGARVAEEGHALPTGEATTGDDLDWDGTRRVDMAAGEAQLSGAQIEAGFDGAMARIRRCLLLVPSDGEIAGTLTFGVRVGSDGTPRAVNLTGPAVVTSGESGICLRKAAEGIRFPAFDGPDMLFRFPITLH